jgi:stage V sporulation protein B
MKRSFLANTLVLTLTAQLLRVAGIYLTAYLTGRIGAEGVGLYQLILSVYFLAATVASSGIGMTVSRLVAESIGKSGGKSICDVLRRAMVFGLLLGAAAGAAVWLLADFIGASLLGDARAIPALRMLAAGLPFMALSSCLQGYFFGVRKALQPSGQMLFEQLVRIALIMAVLDIFIPAGLASSCFAVILCCMISEALSCACAFLLYLIEVRRSSLAVVRESGLTRRMLRIMTPLALTGYMRAGLKTAENMLIPSGLRKYGASEASALSQYAQIGMASMVLFFPSGVLGAAATLLMPEVCEAHAARRAGQVRRIFSRAFQLTALFSLLLSALFLTLGGELGTLIYRNGETGALIAVLAPLVPLLYLDFVVDALLTGLGQQMKTLRINTADYAIRIGLVLLLIPRFGFAAYIVIVYISTFFNAVLSIRRLLIVSGARIDYPGWIIKPLICACIAGLCGSLLQKLLFPVPDAWSVMLQAVLISAVYTGLLFVTRCLTRDDVAWMRRLVRNAKQQKAFAGPLP